jgi:parvulin-like peptidyl-prolyl isomerase
MRENTKWIMMVTAIAFVALMVFEWGMDATGRSSGSLGTLGRVNGFPVTYEAFQLAYRNLYEQVSSSQETPVTAAQNREVEEAAWIELVNQILIQQELERRGIRVTDAEIMQAAQYLPPAELQGDPLFQDEMGTFDITRYQDFLANSADELFLLQLEAYYRDMIPRNKLLRQVTSGIYFTDGELWDQYQFENEQVRVRFVAMNPTARIPDAAVDVPEDEIQDFYDEHQDDFQVAARAELNYVALTKAPLREDTLESQERATDIAQLIRDGGDFAELAAVESSDEMTAQNGGDLGMFTRGRMVPAFDSLVFDAPLNQVQDPIQTSFGFHVVEVLSRQGDSAQARHILIPIERGNESELQLLTLADSLETLGESRTLADAAGALDVPVENQTMTELFPFLTGVGQVADGLDWVFREAAPGEVSPVFEDEQAFYMMELVSATPAGVQPLEDARETIRQALRVEKKVERAREEARELMDRARAGGSLEALAEEEDLEVQEAGPGSRIGFFPGLGVRNAAVGTAFGLEVDGMAGPIVADNNVFLIQTVERIPADSTAWLEGLDMQRAQLAFSLQQQRLQQWIDGMREAARIVDNREQFFQASAQQAQTAPTGGLFY